MKTLRETAKNLWKDESAQGATEYILLLVVVVGLAMLFRDKIKSAVDGLMDKLKGNLDSFNG